MTKSRPPSPIRHADYEAIETALLESARGRWFLAEFSRRNRSADTRMLLDAITRLETTVRKPRQSAGPEPILGDLQDMYEAIALARREIAALGLHAENDPPSPARPGPNAIAAATARATSEILSAAEAIQETAWRLREQGVDAAACSHLDARAAAICTACEIYDFTGQRTHKLIALLRNLEANLASMIGLRQLDDLALRDKPDQEARPEAPLLHGPSPHAEALLQEDVDDILASTLDDIDFVEVTPIEAQPPRDHAGDPAWALDRHPEFEAGPGTVAADRFRKPTDLDLSQLDQTKIAALFC